jgi:hypothetical protein
MRRALFGAALAALAIVPTTSNAADTALRKEFHIQAPVPVTVGTNADNNGRPIGAPCATGGFEDDYDCQKSTYTRVARCLYLTDPATAQSGRNGKVGYVFKINATQVRGADLNDDRDNRQFDLVVTNKTHSSGPGQIALPDVDIAFYADLGVCASDVEGPSGAYVPLQGLGPTQLIGSFPAKAIHNGLGDEVNKLFPSGAYHPQSNPTATLYASSYYAIVTIVGGAEADIYISCEGHGPIGGGPTVSACPNSSWFQQL